ncbi:uncharacterized protein LOC124291922 isoform X2 [Haliotis rubra]|uniref:uncharacterized protein LOC124291922 isoform X2 n=1 Tax=Haliotis rubra TaxID=36100 RepID=UPI001EE5FBAB|nr:uncharacterized protein LOC124291922 isoform X2 [Haliotis rubra]
MLKPGSVNAVCKHWLGGNCLQGDRCVFIHGPKSDRQVSPTPSRRNPSLQTGSNTGSLMGTPAVMRYGQGSVAMPYQMLPMGNMGGQGLVQQVPTSLADQRLLRLQLSAQQMTGLQQMPNVQQQMPNVQQQIPNVQHQMPRLQQHIPGTHQMTGLQQQMPGLQQQMPGLQQQMPGLQQQMPGLQQQMPGLQQQMPGLQQQMPGLQQQMMINPVGLNIYDDQMMSVTGRQGRDPDNSMRIRGIRPKKKSRFHDSSEILLPTGDAVPTKPVSLMDVNIPMTSSMVEAQDNLVFQTSLSQMGRREISSLQMMPKSLLHDRRDGIMDDGPRRKKSRFQNPSEFSNTGRSNLEYGNDEGGTGDDDYVEDFVDEIMSGIGPRIIQTEDSRKNKGISFKTLFNPMRQSLEKNPKSGKLGGRTMTGQSDDMRTREDSWAYQRNQTDDYRKGERLRRDVDSFSSRDLRKDNFIQGQRQDPEVSRRENYSGYGTRELGYGRDNQQNDRFDDQEYRGTADDESFSGRDYQSRYNVENARGTYGPEYTAQHTTAFKNNRSAVKESWPRPQGIGNPKPSPDLELGVKPPREVRLGRPMPEFIEKFMKTAGRYAVGVQRVTTTYNLPSNCVGLLPPKLNAETWDILTKKAQNKDEILQDLQRWFAGGIIPLVKLADLFGNNLQIVEDVCRYVSDSLNVFTFLCFLLSMKRRILMRSSLHKRYGILCRRHQPISGYLFGDRLSQDLERIKAGTFHIPTSEKDIKDTNNIDPEGADFKPAFFASLALPGDDVDINVSNMINVACSSDGNLADLREKYQIPSNCNVLIPPKVNPEIWNLVSQSGLDLDYRIQDVHMSIAESMVPLLIMLQSVQNTTYDESNTLTLLTHSLSLLGNSMYQINRIRMEAIKKSLPSQVHSYCSFHWTGAEMVMVDDS